MYMKRKNLLAQNKEPFYNNNTIKASDSLCYDEIIGNSNLIYIQGVTKAQKLNLKLNL